MPTIKLKKNLGGQRTNAGRPQKLDKHLWGQVTCVLRHDTIARLREGSGSLRFGEFLQHHLDRYPVPSREQYLRIQRRGIPAPKARIMRPWNDKRIPAEERFKLWVDYQRQKKDEADKRARARLVAMGLTESEIDRRRALGREPHNDQPRKIKSRKPLAHSKR